MKEKTNFKRFGVMLDCSRNAVMKVETVKRFIDHLQIMGYNALELYTEDTYEIKDEPRFGYLRGRYTGEEIKEIDAYANSRGVELIPCVQTLGHFSALVRNTEFSDIVDSNDVLLVDEEKAYALIEKIFATLAENFTSRAVNIGMDETFALGRGKFLDKHGYENRFSIFLRHLQRVVQIAEQYGFTPHMWSDMFFRIATGGKYYVDEPFDFPENVVSGLPENIELAYWDYEHYNAREYDVMLDCHARLNRNVWFAGGAWTWTGFAPLNKVALKKTKAAMESVRTNGIKNVLITMWGDDGGECSYFSVLPTLYAARQYADGNFDDEEIKRGFFNLFKVAFDDFLALDLPDMEYAKQVAVSKVGLYNDPLLGIYDKNIEKWGKNPYGEHAKCLLAIAKSAGEYAYIFNSQARLCETLVQKLDFGVRLRKAYQSGEKSALKSYLKELSKIEKRVQAFYKAFYVLWHTENKPHGWEVQDARLGGLIQRLKTCKLRIKEYLQGKIGEIAELEEEILDYADSVRYTYIATRGVTE